MPAPVDHAPPVDEQHAYRLHPKVALRPEPFGALAYHYGNRRLVFLRSPRLVEVVRGLGGHPSLGAALDAAGVRGSARRRYLEAVGGLARSDMVVPVPAAQEAIGAR